LKVNKMAANPGSQIAAMLARAIAQGNRNL
jgi:hypothetical protein